MKSRNRDSGETAEPSQTKAGSEAAGGVNNQPGERERSNGTAVTTPELSKDSGVCRRRSSDVRFGPWKVVGSALRRWQCCVWSGQQKVPFQTRRVRGEGDSSCPIGAASRDAVGRRWQLEQESAAAK